MTYNSSYSPHYPAQGNTALTDGIRGDWTYGDGSWQGFISDNRLDVTIDMEKKPYPFHHRRFYASGRRGSIPAGDSDYFHFR